MVRSSVPAIAGPDVPVPTTTWGEKGETGPPVANAGVGPPGTAPTGAGGGAQRSASRRLRHPRAAITSTSATA